MVRSMPLPGAARRASARPMLRYESMSWRSMRTRHSPRPPRQLSETHDLQSQVRWRAHMNSENSAVAGLIRLRSPHSVAETFARLESLLQQRGVLIFGNPKGGTPLMQSAPSVGIDLPLKALIYQAADGGTTIAYNDPRYITERHGLPAALAANLVAVVPLIEQAAAA